MKRNKPGQPVPSLSSHVHVSSSPGSFTRARLLREFFMLALLASALLVAPPAPAQDWAKARLEKSPRHQEWVVLNEGARKLQCFVVYPEVSKKAAAVVVVHEIFGLSDWAREMADEMAGAGYIAIVPDLLSGTAPNGQGTAGYPDQDAVVRAVSMLPPAQITADLNAATAYVSKLPACNGKVVVTGFCWGGGQAFRFATNNHSLKAAFVFYGPPPASEAEVARIHCPVYGFYGGNDARISSTVPATVEMMKKSHKTYSAVIYPGAGHGFMRAGEAPDASPANRAARDDAWNRWKAIMATGRDPRNPAPAPVEHTGP